MRHHISALVTSLNNFKTDYTVKVPSYKDNVEIINILDKLNYLKLDQRSKHQDQTNLGGLRLELNKLLYTTNYKPYYKVISKPGRKVYINYKNLFNSKQGRELHLIRSSRGIITHWEAQEYKIGGEHLLKIYFKYQ